MTRQHQQPRDSSRVARRRRTSRVRLDVRVQRRDTLYFVIPPADTDGGDTDHVLNQMDLWGSGDQFVWVLPQDEKIALPNMREQYRRTVSERAER